MIYLFIKAGRKHNKIMIRVTVAYENCRFYFCPSIFCMLPVFWFFGKFVFPSTLFPCSVKFTFKPLSGCFYPSSDLSSGSCRPVLSGDLRTQPPGDTAGQVRGHLAPQSTLQPCCEAVSSGAGAAHPTAIGPGHSLSAQTFPPCPASSGPLQRQA